MQCKQIKTNKHKKTKRNLKMQKIYTVRELMLILRLSEPTVLKLIKDKKIRKLNTDGAIRVTENALNTYLKGK
tara:strand:- start:31812 stop:32030 length:219 start_codon:yes stop_codon:yes gene_type:complete